VTALQKFWATIVTFFAIFFVIDDSNYGEIIWMFIWVPLVSVLLSYYTLKLFAWIEDQ